MSRKKPTVLVIDDSEAVLLQIKASLERVGFPVITTTQTVGIARHLTTASIVIIDFHMPGFDGKAVLGSLRASAPPSRRIVFYLYTSDPEVARNAKLLGFDGALRNKGNLYELPSQVSTVASLLALHELGGG